MLGMLLRALKSLLLHNHYGFSSFSSSTLGAIIAIVLCLAHCDLLLLFLHDKPFCTSCSFLSHCTT
jgi:hypothetical protein